MLYTSRDFWCCDFMLDRDVPDDIEFEVGQPVSVGLSQLKIGSGGTFLREVSIVRHGAIKGAEITSRGALKPAPVKPTVSAIRPAARRTTSDLLAAGDDLDDYRPPVWDELERIVGYRVTDENQTQAFLDANRSPLDKLYEEHVEAKRQLEPGVIRRNCGLVLGVR